MMYKINDNKNRAEATSQIDDRIYLARQQVEDDHVILTDDAYFDKAREYIKIKYITDET